MVVMRNSLMRLSCQFSERNPQLGSVVLRFTPASAQAANGGAALEATVRRLRMGWLGEMFADGQ